MEKKSGVPVKIIEEVGVPTVHAKPGDKIANENSIAYTGTFGLVLKEYDYPDKYFLTCCHVLNGGSTTGFKQKVKDRYSVVLIEDDRQPSTIGMWSRAHLNETLDIALITPAHDFKNFINTINGDPLGAEKAVTKEDKDNHKQVQLYGAESKGQAGVIVDTGWTVPLKYTDEVT